MGSRKFQLDQAEILLCEGIIIGISTTSSQKPAITDNTVKNSLFTLINRDVLIMFFTWIFCKFIKGDIFT